MNRIGPPSWGGPRSDQNDEAGHHRIKSDAGNASPKSISPNAQSSFTVATIRLEIILKCVAGHGGFSADFNNGMQIVTASRQPICDAARVLHGLGYPDDALLVARHDGAEHEAMRGPL